MALTLGNPDSFATSTRNAQADAFDDQVNAQATQRLVLLSSAPAVLAAFTLDGTNAFGSASSGAITLTGLPLQDSSADSGSATAVARWAIEAPNSTQLMSGPVTGSDTITAGQIVNLTAFTLTWPAS